MADKPMTVADLLHAAEMQAKHTQDLVAAVRQLHDGATSRDFAGPNGALAALMRICRDHEGGVTALRADVHFLLTGQPAPRGNAPALIYAIKTKLEENDRAAGIEPQDTLRAAMALADEVEAVPAAVPPARGVAVATRAGAAA